MMWLLALLLLLLPTLAHAQAGFILVGPGTQRATCTAITAPVTNQTWCADGSLGPTGYNWFIWNGTAWVPIAGGGGGAPGAPTRSTQINSSGTFAGSSAPLHVIGSTGTDIQAAITAAPSGGLVQLEPIAYAVGDVTTITINKALTLRCTSGGRVYFPDGAPTTNSRLIGGPSQTILTVNTNQGVTIEDCQFTNGSSGTAISLTGPQANATTIIQRNYFDGGSFGVVGLPGKTLATTIRDNVFAKQGTAGTLLQGYSAGGNNCDGGGYTLDNNYFQGNGGNAAMRFNNSAAVAISNNQVISWNHALLIDVGLAVACSGPGPQQWQVVNNQFELGGPGTGNTMRIQAGYPYGSMKFVGNVFATTGRPHTDAVLITSTSDTGFGLVFEGNNFVNVTGNAFNIANNDYAGVVISNNTMTFGTVGVTDVLTGTTHTTAIITGISPNTSGLRAGMSIKGSGIPAGATILSVDSSSQITLSVATTSSLVATVLAAAHYAVKVTNSGYGVLVTNNTVLNPVPGLALWGGQNYTLMSPYNRDGQSLASLPVVLDGSTVWCNDCLSTSAVCSSGGTGSTARRQNQRWVCSEMGVVNAQYYGVLPGNTALDNSINVDAAILAACGGTLYFPPGVYTFSGSLNVTCANGLTIVGAGAGRTPSADVSNANQGTTFSVNFASSPVINVDTQGSVQIKDLRMTQAGTLAGSGCISATNASGPVGNDGLTLSNIVCSGGDTGIYTNRAAHLAITNSRIENFVAIGLAINSQQGCNPNGSMITGTEFVGGTPSGTSTFGIINNGSGLAVTGSNISNVTNGLLIRTASSAACASPASTMTGVTITGNTIANSATTAVGDAVNVLAETNNIDTVVITGNTLVPGTGNGCIAVSRASTFTVKNVSISGNSCGSTASNAHGITFDNVTGMAITGNTWNRGTGGTGAWITSNGGNARVTVSGTQFVQTVASTDFATAFDYALVQQAPIAFANLQANDNGSSVYCADCLQTTPCTGAGAGAFAVRVNGAWQCIAGSGAGGSPGGALGTFQFNNVGTVFGGTDVLYATAFGLSTGNTAAQNATAMSAAIAALNGAGGGTLIIPAGTYSLNTSTTLAVAADIRGEMGTILVLAAAQNGITVGTASPVRISGIAFVNGARGILFTGGASGTFSIVEDNLFQGQTTGSVVYASTGNQWTVRRNVFIDTVDSALLINIPTDSCECVVEGNTFAGNLGTAGVNWLGGGNLRILNNKFNLPVGGSASSIRLHNIGVGTSEIVITGNVLSNGAHGILVDGSLVTGNFVIVGNNINSSGTGLVVFNATTDTSDLLLSGNNFSAGVAGIMVDLQQGNRGFIEANSFLANAAGATAINCAVTYTNLTIGINNFALTGPGEVEVADACSAVFKPGLGVADRITVWKSVSTMTSYPGFEWRSAHRIFTSDQTISVLNPSGFDVDAAILGSGTITIDEADGSTQFIGALATFNSSIEASPLSGYLATSGARLHLARNAAVIANSNGIIDGAEHSAILGGQNQIISGGSVDSVIVGGVTGTVGATATRATMLGADTGTIGDNTFTSLVIGGLNGAVANGVTRGISINGGVVTTGDTTAVGGLIFLAGMSNVVAGGATDTYVLGTNNDATGASQVIASGFFNTLTSASASGTWGIGNTVSGAGAAFAFGQNNSVDGLDSEAFGETNLVQLCNSCVAVGQLNTLGDGINPVSDNYAFGSGHTMSGSDNQLFGQLLNDGGFSNVVSIGQQFTATANNTLYIGMSATPEVAIASSTVSVARAVNGQSANIKLLTEETTILVAAFTDTTIQAPANSLVLGVSVRVTTIIPTAATFDVGVAGATTRYGTGILVAATTTFASPGTTNPTIYGAATSIRITPNLMPLAATGKVRVTITYLDLTPPSS